MSLTTLDPKTALVVVDLQKGIMSRMLQPHTMGDVVARSSTLANEFRKRALPVVLVNVTGVAPGRTEQSRAAGAAAARPADWADIVPEMNQQPQDLLITKRTWGAFTNTSLAADLRKLGITQVVITGVATSIGAETTAREAYSHGFNVTIAVDAVSDLDIDSHVNSVKRVFPRLGEVGTTKEIIELLGKTHPAH